ncbi:hypothetical protein N9937_00190 [bacterium]|nr:hypothetical protein [bacterium]
MDKSTQLFIRACKVDQSKRRLLKLYRTHYYGGTQTDDECMPHIARILTDIVEKYCPQKLSTIVQDLSPQQCWYYQIEGEELPYYHRVAVVMEKYIAWTDGATLVGQGLTRPARFRK